MSHNQQRFARLIERLGRLNPLQLDEVERLVAGIESVGHYDLGEKEGEEESGDESPHSKDWPHAPLHRLQGKGTYFVTAGTLNKQHHFRGSELLDALENELLTKAKQYQWQLEAWAVFSNHYHFVGQVLEDAGTLRPFLAHLHADTARETNRRDGKPGRQVWFNYWDTELTYEKSYLARLNYVHQNPVRHGLVPVANQYLWCSAAWFEPAATRSQIRTIWSFKADGLSPFSASPPPGDDEG